VRTSRAEYSPIVGRKPLRLPEGKRVAVWFIVNVEAWRIDAPMARELLPAPQGVQVMPNVPNYSWFEYGLRVGFWRIKEVLDRHGIRATASLNGVMCEEYPDAVRAMVEAGWELLGHNYYQRVIQAEPDEREAIRKTRQAIEAASGRPMRGWMGPGLHETWETPDVLAEEGIEYCADWVNDDQPYLMRVKSGRLISIPYTVELNDIPIYLVQHHRAPELLERVQDQYATLSREAADENGAGARVLPVSVHPYITGVGYRIPYFDRLCAWLKEQPDAMFFTGGELADWYKQQVGL
jgi:allantoinase